MAGFTKRDDFRYFLKAIGDIEYVHMPELAPTKEILDEYKGRKGDWGVYERQFDELIRDRAIEDVVEPELLDGACLLCSESGPENCHRRLVAEYLGAKLRDIEIHHL